MILIKEEFVGSEKYRRAVKLGGSDAIAMWLALKCYCSRHPDTAGFVPAEVLDGLPGAPRRSGRALRALQECGRLLPGGDRGAGLVERAELGWQMHDYLDHAPAPEEHELRREKERLRKQSYREGKRRELDAVRRLAGDLSPDSPGHSGDTEGDNPGDAGETIAVDIYAGAGAPAGAREPAPARGGAHPNQTQPNQKNPGRVLNAIRPPHPVEAGPSHRQFAAEHGLALEPFLAELRTEAAVAALGPDEIRARLSAMLEQAVSLRPGPVALVGGAA